jgi:glutathione S-transferase
MYRLFYAENSAAMGIRVILEEIGAEYELISTEIGTYKPRSLELLKYNPNGWVPVLVSSDGAIYECAAITIFLADRHVDAGLAPAFDDPLRGPYLQWLVYFSSSLQTAYQMTWYWDRFCVDARDQASVNARSATRLREIWSVIDNALEGKSWILGERFSAADIYMYMLTTWLSEAHGHPPLNAFPNVLRIAEAVYARPAVHAVYG